MGYNSKVVDLEDFDEDEFLSQSDSSTSGISIFLVATYGEGEPTDNARDFFDWISEQEEEEGDLSWLKFTVFGLGNKVRSF